MTGPELHEPADVYSEEGYYAVVPEWVLDADISAQAVRLYAVLRRYADQRTREAHPSRKTLAARIKVTDVKVVDRALADLQRIGAVEVFGRWKNEDGEIVYAPDDRHRERSSNGYRLRRTAVLPGGRGGGPSAPTGSRATRGGGPGGEGVGAEKGEKPQPRDHSHGDHKTDLEEVPHLSRGPAEQPSPPTPASSPPPAPAAPGDGLGPEPSAHCAQWPHPPRPCPPCGDARQANTAWWAEETARRRDRDAAARAQQRQKRELADAELETCWLCDGEGTAVVTIDGERVQSLCLHDADRNVAAVVNRRAARAAITRRGAGA